MTSTVLSPAAGSGFLRQPDVLPMSAEELQTLGWDALDILLVSGDAYVDHPSFGAAILGRVLVDAGFRVGIVAQPRWEGEGALPDIMRMGRPRLFTGVTAGAVDSMLARYTAFRKQRSDDAYTPGGKAGARPNRAVIVYANLVRRAFPGLPLVIGGIEASLRRASHYDFWSDSLRRSLLFDSKADLLVYGMGENAILGAARAAEEALRMPEERETPFRKRFSLLARNLPGVAVSLGASEAAELFPPECGAVVRLPSHEAIQKDAGLLVRATIALEQQVHQAKYPALQASGDRVLVINPPSPPLETPALDTVYALPFSRLPHPAYTLPVPAWEMIRTSITSHRGCGGGCAFCSLALHQTRRIASRSRESVLAEARRIATLPVRHAGKAGGKEKVPVWAGSISDVGGPSANMWRASCSLDPAACKRASCLFPAPCSGFAVKQREGVALLREVAAQEGVRHVRVASGVRFDLALRDDVALAAYTCEFTGGQLKVAPEHSADAVLRLMRKPSLDVFETFLARFASLSAGAGKEQYVIPYLMSAYPGCTDAHMRELAAWLKARNWSPRQVQCFIPTPGTVATAMFYAGTDTDGNSIHVARTDAERMRQHYILLGGEGKTCDTGTTGPRRAPATARDPRERAARGGETLRRDASRKHRQKGGKGYNDA